jgi:hypothetical protein
MFALRVPIISSVVTYGYSITFVFGVVAISCTTPEKWDYRHVGIRRAQLTITRLLGTWPSVPVIRGSVAVAAVCLECHDEATDEQNAF